MNSGESVIPPRNNRLHQADSSHQILDDEPIRGCELIEKAGLSETTIIDKSDRESLT
jgi:hypothetical protein